MSDGVDDRVRAELLTPAYSPLYENGRKSRAQTTRDLCQDASLFTYRTCADNAREREESFESQNTIQARHGQSQNAIPRFLLLAMIILVRRRRAPSI